MTVSVSFHQLPESGKDVGVGPDGSIWIVTTNPVGSAGDFGIAKFNGTTFDPVGGVAGVRIVVSPNGKLFVLSSKGLIFVRDPGDSTFFELPAFAARDIAVGVDGSMWAIGTNAVGTDGDFGIFQLTGSIFEPVFGGGVGIAVGPDGLPLVVKSNGQMVRRTPSPERFNFEQLPGTATHISMDGDGSILAIGTKAVGNIGDFGVTALGPEDTAFKPLNGAGVRIAAFGGAFVINANHQVLKSEFPFGGGGLVFKPFMNTPAREIAFGDTIWLVGTNVVDTDGNFGIWRFNNIAFEPVAGGAGVRIGVGGQGWPVVVKAKHEILRGVPIGNQFKFIQIPGEAQDVGVGHDGSVWVIGINAVGNGGRDFGISRLNGTDFVPVAGVAGVRIAVTDDGLPMVVDSQHRIFRGFHGNLQQFPATAKETAKVVAVGSNGSIWKIGTNPVGIAKDFGISRFNGTAFETVVGGGVRIAVGPDGLPVVVNSQGLIFRGMLSPG
jgi:hypothetical protein